MHGIPQAADYSDSAYPTQLEYVLPAERIPPSDLRWFALELYRLAHGNCWGGELTTAARMNQVIDWWNGSYGG